MLGNGDAVGAGRIGQEGLRIGENLGLRGQKLVHSGEGRGDPPQSCTGFCDLRPMAEDDFTVVCVGAVLFRSLEETKFAAVPLCGGFDLVFMTFRQVRNNDCKLSFHGVFPLLQNVRRSADRRTLVIFGFTA